MSGDEWWVLLLAVVLAAATMWWGWAWRGEVERARARQEEARRREAKIEWEAINRHHLDAPVSMQVLVAVIAENGGVVGLSAETMHDVARGEHEVLSSEDYATPGRWILRVRRRRTVDVDA